MQLATRTFSLCISFSYARVEWSICGSTEYIWIRDDCYFYRGSQFYSMEHRGSFDPIKKEGLYELLRKFHSLLCRNAFVIHITLFSGNYAKISH
jgi:hypothetical protein